MNTITSDIQLKNDANIFAKTIFNFVIESKYDSLTSIFDMQRDIINKSFYLNHIQNRAETLVKDLEGINFYENQIYENVPDIERLEKIQKTLNNFQLAIFKVFIQEGKMLQGKGSVTSVNSPLQRKFGNNKLDIKPTGRDYGLLFR